MLRREVYDKTGARGDVGNMLRLVLDEITVLDTLGSPIRSMRIDKLVIKACLCSAGGGDRQQRRGFEERNGKKRTVASCRRSRTSRRCTAYQPTVAGPDACYRCPFRPCTSPRWRHSARRQRRRPFCCCVSGLQGGPAAGRVSERAHQGGWR